MTHSHLLPGLQSFTHLKIADFIFYHRLSYVSIYQHAIQGLIAQSQPQFRWRHSAVILIHPDMDPSPKITSPHSSCLNPNFSWSKQSKPPIFPWKKMKKTISDLIHSHGTCFFSRLKFLRALMAVSKLPGGKIKPGTWMWDEGSPQGTQMCPNCWEYESLPRF